MPEPFVGVGYHSGHGLDVAGGVAALFENLGEDFPPAPLGVNVGIQVKELMALLSQLTFAVAAHGVVPFTRSITVPQRMKNASTAATASTVNL
ncbi:hypothetical protein ACIRPT_02795 [Streptomyces sp. NPDC101227]|uniref:hypothetical protein n=1 Tax=Streptomyces sp. NPDC101227 TaxID=3366136 RepID=UPI00380AE51C